jgi:GPH family glycoside/pentoside/hexuronide:cation symporter
VATLAFLLCIASTREAPANPIAMEQPLFEEVRAFLRVVRRSGPLLQLLLGRFLSTLCTAMQANNTVYYFKYVLGAAGATPLVLPLLIAFNVVGVALWVRVTRRAGKRSAWLLGSLATAAISLCLSLPALPLGWALALLAANALGTSAYAVCAWSMLPDTVEYNEWRFRRRDEAKVFGIASFTQKVAMGVAALFAGAILDHAGFAANHPQSPAALSAIRAIMGIVPAVAAILAWLAMRNYPLDARAHQRFVRALERRAPKTESPPE